MAMEALYRAAEESKRREVEEALRRKEEGERSEVQWLAVERRIKALKRMEAECFEAELWQEAELRQEAELQRPESDTTEAGEGSGTGVLEEEEVWDKYNKEDVNEEMKTSREEINGTDEDAEQDEYVSYGDEDIVQDAVRGSGGSEAEKWEGGGSNGDED